MAQAAIVKCGISQDLEAMLFCMRSKSSRRQDQQKLLLEKAASRIEQLQQRLEQQQKQQEALQGKEQYMLSQLEGAWELPVMWSPGPAEIDAVTVTEPSDKAPGLAALTVLGLQSAFPARARLDSLGESGFAIVRAWPLNAPGALERLPGYRTASYILCALTSLGLFKAGAASTAKPSAAGFEARI